MTRKLFMSLLLPLVLIIACDDTDADGEGVTELQAGDGLTVEDNDGVVTVELDTSMLQQRVDGTCSGDTAVQEVEADGAVVCSAAMATADHTHGTDYAATSHNHDSDYAAISHDHGTDYATAAHDHAGVYAEVAHDHDTAYSAIGHDHAGVYAATAHDHDGDYLATAGFTGHTTSDCDNDGGFIIIGNIQEEFGCHVNCDDICSRNGLTCSRVFNATGTPGTCSGVHNSAVEYCWCIQ